MMRAPLKLALVLALGLVTCQPNQAQVKPARPAFTPACDLQALNREYVAALNRLRRQLNPLAPEVRFDPILFVGTVLHTANMEAKDSLVHAYVFRYSAEMIGTKKSIQVRDARKLALFALSQFENSEAHCRIQETVKYVWVAIAAGDGYYCVRLSDEPMEVDRGEQAAFVKLGVKPVMEVR